MTAGTRTEQVGDPTADTSLLAVDLVLLSRRQGQLGTDPTVAIHWAACSEKLENKYSGNLSE